MQDTRFSNLLQLHEINRLASEDADGFIKFCEEEYNNKLKNIAKTISEDKGRTIVALSGPSGSGKTTSAHFLMKHLALLGIDAVTVSFDNFYKGKDKAPILPDGSRDYESIYALDIPVMHKSLNDIVKTGYCEMPEFDFTRGMPKPAALKIKLSDNGIIILEGIHALNPIVIDAVSDVTDKKVYKIYVSVKSGISDGGNEILSPRDMRLIRRMTRDFTHRNSTPQNTLHLWTNVVAGEKRYLSPFKNTADICIDSIHPYEPCVFKQNILPLLKKVNPEDENYELAANVLKNIQKFEDINLQKLPETSLLREFIEIN